MSGSTRNISIWDEDPAQTNVVDRTILSGKHEPRASDPMEQAILDLLEDQILAVRCNSPLLWPISWTLGLDLVQPFASWFELGGQ